MQLNELLAQIDGLKAEIDRLRPLKPEVEHRIMRKFRLDWNYHSNAIEGNSLTLGETRAFLLEGLTANGKPLKDHLDIRGHDDLITFLELFIQRKERLTEASIREMHKILLKEPYETDAVTADGRIVKRKVQLGVYKSEPNGVRMASGEFHQYTLPADVPARMADLIEWHRKQLDAPELHPVALATIFHHRFVSIHPFDDGNGRMGRILMNLILMRSGFPPIVIKLQNREAYVSALRQADAGEIQALSVYLAQNLLDSEALYLRGAKGESIEDFDDVDKQVSLLKQELKNEPPPIALSQKVQETHWAKELGPLLERLNAKVKQFDELFSGASCGIIIQRGGHQFGPESGNPIGRETLVPVLCKFSRESSQPAQGLHISYNWSGFLGQATTAFNISMEMKAQYFDRQLIFYPFASQNGKLFKYGQWYSEDEIRKLLSDWAKMILEGITAQRRI